MPPPLSPVGDLVRRHDPDRFLTALFSPPEPRETLFLLYALNHELARAREVASEPTLALIRLQWWREVVEGARRRHEVATPLGEALDAGRIDAADLLGIIEGREVEADSSLPTLATWHHYLRATAGGLAVAAGRVLGADAASLERLRSLGTAYGIAGQLRSIAALARQGRCLLPEETLAAHGISTHEVIANPHDPRLRPVLRALADDGQQRLRAAGGRMPRAIVAAALPAVLARRDLRRPGSPGQPRGLADRLAVLAAALAGRC